MDWVGEKRIELWDCHYHFFSLAITELRRRLGKIHPSKQSHGAILPNTDPVSREISKRAFGGFIVKSLFTVLLISIEDAATP